MQFIRDAARSGRPFFLYLPDFLVHAPLEAKEAYLGHFRAKPPSQNHRSPVAAAMIKSLDDTVGTVLRALDDTGLAANTLVIFGSDNGGLAYAEDGAREQNTSNLPLRGRKGSEFDGGFRVPYIVRWPGHVPPGTTNPEPITGADLYPTFLELAGAPRPGHVLDGASLVPLFRGPSARLPSREIIWYLSHYTSFNRPCIVVRRGEWKLIHLFDGDRDELYHTGNDIGERDDLALRQPELTRELRARALAWMKEAGAPPMRPNPDFDPAAARAATAAPEAENP